PITLMAELGEVFPKVGLFRSDLAKNYYNLALLYRASKRDSLGEPLVRQALELQEAVVRDHPDSVDYRRSLATACQLLSQYEAGHGHPRVAEDLRARCLHILEDPSGEQPADVAIQASLTGAYDGMGHFLFSTSRVAEAESWFCQAHARWQTIVKDHSKSTDYLDSLVNTVNSLGVCREILGRPED